MSTWLEVMGPTWTTGGPGMLYDSDAWFGSCKLQVSKLPSTKSDSVAVGLCEERVSPRKVEKQVGRPRALRFTPSSRNSPACGRVLLCLSVNAQGTEIGALFTMAKVLPLIALPLLRAT